MRSQPDHSGAPQREPSLPRLPDTLRVSHVARTGSAAASGTSCDTSSDIPITLPGSKYYTLRYLLAAALADGQSTVEGPAVSDDTMVLVRALRCLGAAIEWQPTAPGEHGWRLAVRGTAGRPTSPPDGTLQLGNAGAVMRMLLGIGAVLPRVRFETDHRESLGRRPNADLLRALEELGIAVEATGPEGLLPITLRGGPPHGGKVSVSGARSSQYLSALLLLAPLLRDGLHIFVEDELRSEPFIRTTLQVMAAAGIQVEAASDLRTFTVAGRQSYKPRASIVPADAPSLAALVAAALAARRPLALRYVSGDDPDMRSVLEAYAALGVPLRPDAAGILRVPADLPLRGTRLDGNTRIDSVPALVAAACFADGETRIERVATLRLKESNRIEDLCDELRRAGCDVTPEPDAIVVRGKPDGIPGGAIVAGHDDHRLVQALAIAALRSAHGLTITGADAIAKSYPHFFDDLARLGAQTHPHSAG